MNLTGLNNSQKEAVETIQGPLMVLAGAGSGKTKTLVTRIQYLLEELYISPFKILAVTFSNKASKEMRDRVAQSSNIDAGALQITAFSKFYYL
jgi:DNA helicase-2/ATP-dependent DNA helicase PcrA